MKNILQYFVLISWTSSDVWKELWHKEKILSFYVTFRKANKNLIINNRKGVNFMILAHKIHCNINIFKRFKLLEGGSLLKKSRYEEALPPCPPPPQLRAWDASSNNKNNPYFYWNNYIQWLTGKKSMILSD